MKFLSLFLSILFLVGCEKSIENFTPYPGVTNDTAWVASNSASLEINSLHQELMTTPISDSFNLQTGAALQLGNTSQLEIPSAAFSLGGNVATGTAKVDLYLLRTKGDFIRFRKPTVSGNNLLHTSNAFLINASKNGQSLTLLNSKFLRINLTDTFTSSSYKAFLGIEPSLTSFTNYTWAEAIV